MSATPFSTCHRALQTEHIAAFSFCLQSFSFSFLSLSLASLFPVSL
jgi:hypothetical protein